MKLGCPHAFANPRSDFSTSHVQVNKIIYKKSGPCEDFEMRWPTIIYSQIMDCILMKIKPPKLYQLTFVG